MGRCTGRHASTRCLRDAVSPRARFCKQCYLKKASASGQKSKGNSNASGTVANSGNRNVGRTKKAAGQRSWLKRQASDILIIKDPWLKLILRKKKTWEIRGTSTTKRGIIHLARSGSGGQILGSAMLTNCIALTREALEKHRTKHRIKDLSSVNYDKIYAWVLAGARRYQKPMQYKHAQGAIIWVKAHKWFLQSV